MDSMHPDLREAIMAEVDSRFLGLIQAINAMDAAAWAAYYSDAGDVTAIAGVEGYDSKAAWVQAVTGYFASRASQEVRVEAVRIEPLAANLALLTSRERTTMRRRDGGEVAGRHVFTMLWRKDRDAWKIVHSHESWSDGDTAA